MIDDVDSAVPAYMQEIHEQFWVKVCDEMRAMIGWMLNLCELLNAPWMFSITW